MTYTIKFYANPFVPFHRAHIGCPQELIEEREKIFTNKDTAISFWEECCNPISEYPTEITFVPYNGERTFVLEEVISSNHVWLDGNNHQKNIYKINKKQENLRKQLKQLKN